jgi:glycosyltransferase involved in cell wall biosynthesis
MASRLFIHAVNVHQGGGRALLLALLQAMDNATPCVCLLDSRMPLDQKIEQSCNLEVRRVAATIASRLQAEFWLRNHVKPGDGVLCFGNLPPLFRLPAHVRVYVQNRYLVDGVPLNGTGWWTRVRLTIERKWLRAFARNADGFDVQTESMDRLLKGAIKVRLPVAVRPFVPALANHASQTPESVRINPGRATFLYLASGETHKNHERLLAAWILLGEAGLYPELVLTFDVEKFRSLSNSVDEAVNRNGLCVRNLGVVDVASVADLYATSTALIYPSLLESFGLPLLEAQAAGLPVVAAELDYVRDLIDPVESFDPLSSVSIAHAVRRFLGQPKSKVAIGTAEEYLQHVRKEMALP